MGKHRVVVGSDDACWLDIEVLVKSTELAKLYRFATDGEERWVPKSVIIDEGPDVIGVQKWWAAKNKLESDW